MFFKHICVCVCARESILLNYVNLKDCSPWNVFNGLKIKMKETGFYTYFIRCPNLIK
jgi:hypothetical protein